MADSPTNPAPVLPPERLVRLRRASRRRWRLWPFVLGLAVLAVATAVGWWAIAGNKFWTDGAGLHLADNEARIREVVWTPPIPLTIFNTTDQEYEPSISPDGDELYFVRGKAGQNPGGPGHNADIYMSCRRSGAWTPPVPVDAINSDYDDLGPRVTADGKFLLFYSNRPGGFGGYDIWAAPRLPADGGHGAAWGKPFNLGPGVNTEFDEYNPDSSPDGQRLFFATNRKTASGEQKQAWRATIRTGRNADFDLWYAVRDGGAEVRSSEETAVTRASGLGGTGAKPGAKPQAAESIHNLVFKNAIEVPGVNTPFAEGASCMSPAGDFLYFASDRPGGYGKFDIYRSRVGADGTFGPVENLGPTINTSDNETDPQLALNGFRLYFSSDRQTGAWGGKPAPGESAAAQPAEGGGYDLLQSDSREVYSVRTGHRLPHVGWSWLVLALSLLALVPLVMFMRKWDDQRFSLIQKCMLVSLLVHLLITLGLSMKKVSGDVYHYVRQEQGIEPPIDLTLTLNGPSGRGDNIGAAIRQQSSSDIPAPAAPPTAFVRQSSGAEAPQAAAMPAGAFDELMAGAQLNIPRAGLGAPDLMIQVGAPKPETPQPAMAGELPQVQPTATPRAFDLDLKIAAAPRVSQAARGEAMAQPAPKTTTPAARVDPGQVGIAAQVNPASLRAALPTVDVAARSEAGDAPRAMPAPAGMAAGTADASKLAQANPASLPDVGNLAAPTARASKVAAADPSSLDLKPVAEPLTDLSRQAVPAADGASTRTDMPSALSVAISRIPTAEGARDSLVGGAAPHVAQSAAAMASNTTSPVPQVPENVDLPVHLTPQLPGPTAGPLASRQPDSPEAGEMLSGPSRKGPDSPAITPDASTTGVAGAKLPAIASATESLASAPDARSAAGIPLAPTASVNPATPVDLPAGPAIAPQTRAGQQKAAVVGQGDVVAAGEVPGTVARRESAASSAHPIDANLAGIASARPTAVTGPNQSLATALDARSAARVPLASPASVDPATPADLAGPALAPQTIAGQQKVAVPGQPDMAAAGEVPGALTRRESAPSTQPIAANLAGLASVKPPAAAGSTQSLATAADARSAAGIPLASPASVDPATPADLTAGPAISPRTIADGRKAAASARPDAPAAGDVAAAPVRRESVPSTQPIDANLAAIASASPPAVTGSTESLANSIDASTITPPAVALAQSPAGRATGDTAAAPDIAPKLALPRVGVSPAAVPDAAAVEVAAGPKKLDSGPADVKPVAAPIDAASSPAALGSANKKQDSAVESLASAATVWPRRVVVGPIGQPSGPVGPVVAAGQGIAIEGPKTVSSRIAAPALPAGNSKSPPDGTDGGAASARRSAPAGDTGRPSSSVVLASARIPGISARPLPRSAGSDPAGNARGPGANALPPMIGGSPAVEPEVGVPKLTAPESLFQRSAEQRKPLVEKRGGTPESEGAVERALAYLSRQQEPDGRWTVFNDDGQPGKRGRHPHDMACTGLASLAFLTADHTPAREGPYRDSVARAIDFLLSQEDADGDLRGPRQFRGGGADQGNLYDQGVCTMALCEAALMTGDRRYTDAALRAAQFIVKSQNAEGGWRYSPAEAGDTSVLGWQMLALHDAEQLGFAVPAQTKARAEKYLKSASQGETKILAGYMPGHGASSAMTAEALFSRLLLGEEITGPQTKEVCAYLTRELPQPGGADFYFWYYASLSLSQMPDLAKSAPGVPPGGPEAKITADAWKKWNTQTRDTLIKMQKKGGPADGSWSDSTWAERGGRVFTTSLATLTLEVYYRYLPLRAPADDDSDAAPAPKTDPPKNDPRRASAEIKASRPVIGTNRTPVKPRGKSWDDQGGHYPGIEPN